MSRNVFVGLFALTAVLIAVPVLTAQDAGPAEPAYINVKVPAAATLIIEGQATKQSGELRRFVSPPLAGVTNKKYTYTIRATWSGKDGKETTRTEVVQVFPGKTTEVDLLSVKAEEKTTSPATTKAAEPAKTAVPAATNVAKTNEPAKSGTPAPVAETPKKSTTPPALSSVAPPPPPPPVVKTEEKKTTLPPLTGTEPKKEETKVVAAPKLPVADPKVEDDKDRRPDVIYVPTPQEVVDKMLELAGVKAGEIVYDLGCGDGRIPITASRKYGVKAWGFDIDPERIKDCQENLKKETKEVVDRVTIEKKDIFTLDLSKANVVTLYLLPSLNVKLIPQLEKLKPGSRIVSHDFDMRGVTPDKTVEIQGPNRKHTLYLWTVPLKKEKE